MDRGARFQRIGMVARWQPVHLGHVPVLRALCSRSAEALIGIGSSNRQNARSPFTLEETAAMIRLVLAEWDNYTLIPVPDLDDGPRWRVMVRETFGPLDAYVTANPYVASLMAEFYEVIPPVSLVSEEERVPVSGTRVRRAMARGDGWQAWVPEPVADYIVAGGLDERFRREYGLETLALDAILDP
jgi:nicotinamide-nucleotide adenylyltransferase